MNVRLEQISDSTEFFTREEINSELVEHYADLVSNNISLPAISVFEDPVTKKYVILNGFHTYHAALKANAGTINIEISAKETELDRYVEGVKKNSTHGHPLTGKDKRKVIERILRIDDSWSDQVIATIAGTTDRTVANVRKYLRSASPKISGIREINCIRNGKPHVVRVIPPQSQSNDDGPFHDIGKGLQKSDLGHADAPVDYNHMLNLLLPQNTPDSSTCSSAESEIPEHKRALVIMTLKHLQQKCMAYARMVEAANDGVEAINLAFLKRLAAILNDLRSQNETTITFIDQVANQNGQ
ncbi:MAG: hypothetical protein SGJ18_15255 [Pseudomonadota bacterium]|nr:hypothetical protein [Pseudomonadota bacterium]